MSCIGPYCQAMRDAGIHVGLYFSHLDWSHPDNNAIIRPDTDLPYHPRTFPQGEPDPERRKSFHQGQLQELMTNYGTIDLMWFDGDWEKNALQWDMKGLREYLHSLYPHVVLNSRMQGYGDYETLFHQLQVLRDSDIHLPGLEFHYPFVDPGVLFDTFGDSVLFVPFLSPQGHDRFPRFSDYLFYLHTLQKPNTRLWLLLDPNDPDYPRQLEAARKIIKKNPK